MKVNHRGPAAPRLAQIRTRWLEAVIGALRADRLVVGSALVGSLGDGRADDWSDVDLLIVVDDVALDAFATPSRLPGGPGQLGFAIDARHNGPLGTRAISAQYIIGGLPLWVDWHLHPVSLASWPSDSAVVFDRRGIDQAQVTFSEYLNRGQHEPAIPGSADDHQALRLALVPVAGKQLIRRSPETPKTIEFLGGSHEPDATREDQLTALRSLLDGFQALGRHASLSAGYAYLALVEEALH